MAPSSLPPLIALVGLVVAAIAWQAARRPVQRRLALRNVARRPAEAALVVAGSLLGTALITGSLIVGDTLDSSIRATATTQLGPVDEAIMVPDARDAPTIERRIDALDDERIDGVLSIVSVEASLVSQRSGDARSEPDSQLIEVDFDAARGFGGDPQATGIVGATPVSRETAITEDLARVLDVDVGDEVVAFLYGSKTELRVARILERRGIAGYSLGPRSESFNAFVEPGTIARATTGKVPAGTIPPVSTVLVSNRGGVEDGAELTDEVTPLLERALGSSLLRVEPVKRRRLDTAQEQGDQFSELFIGIGAFAIAAGILLLVNIFVMLSEERKSQLGMLRAVGLRRWDLIRSFAIEGFVYSVAAGGLGAMLGIGVGWAIATLMAPIFGGFDDFALELSFAMTPASIAGGFCIGVLISFATIFFTSIRISRINIISAIRDLPAARTTRTRLRTYAAGIVLAALASLWFATTLRSENQWAPALLGPPLIGLGSLPILMRLLRRRRAVLLVASFSLFWGVFGNAILDERFFQSGEIFAFVAQGLLLTLSAVVLFSHLQENLEVLLRRLAARNVSLRLGLAYPLARRFRTGLTLGMYALVIFTMTFIAVLSSVFGGQVEDFARRGAGGFDVLVTASRTNPPTAEQLRAVRGVSSVATLRFGTALFHPDTLEGPEPWTATGVDAAFVAGSPPQLEDRQERFADDRAAWRALLSDPKAMIVPSFFLEGEGGPPQGLVEIGDTVDVIDPITGRRTERTVIATIGEDIAFGGAHMSKRSLEVALGRNASASRFFIRTTGGEEAARDVAAAIQGRYFRNGAEADSFLALAEQFQALNLQFFRLMQGYLALGLLVGIAGLGVVMVRSVRERRREIGVLRSLGFLSTQVRRAFVLESGFMAFEGIVVGTVLALVTAAQLINSGEFGDLAGFSIPWTQLGLLAGGALVASLLATAWPAEQASRIAPAVALRTAE